MSQPSSHCQTISHSGDAVHVVQLTDTHLCKIHGGTLLGMDTDHSLQAVIDLVKAQRPTIDLLLGTAQGKGLKWAQLGRGMWPPPLVNYYRNFECITRKVASHSIT